MTAPIVDTSGKSVMITGATAGIAQNAAFALAKMGAELTIVCRNKSKGEARCQALSRSVHSHQAIDSRDIRSQHFRTGLRG